MYVPSDLSKLVNWVWAYIFIQSTKTHSKSQRMPVEKKTKPKKPKTKQAPRLAGIESAGRQKQ